MLKINNTNYSGTPQKLRCLKSSWWWLWFSKLFEFEPIIQPGVESRLGDETYHSMNHIETWQSFRDKTVQVVAGQSLWDKMFREQGHSFWDGGSCRSFPREVVDMFYNVQTIDSTVCRQSVRYMIHTSSRDFLPNSEPWVTLDTLSSVRSRPFSSPLEVTELSVHPS